MHTKSKNSENRVLKHLTLMCISFCCFVNELFGPCFEWTFAIHCSSHTGELWWKWQRNTQAKCHTQIQFTLNINVSFESCDVLMPACLHANFCRHHGAHKGQQTSQPHPQQFRSIFVSERQQPKDSDRHMNCMKHGVACHGRFLPLFLSQLHFVRQASTKNRENFAKHNETARPFATNSRKRIIQSMQTE